VRVSFNELAERELNDAIQYFEYEQSGLGAAFLAEVRRVASDRRQAAAADERRSQRRASRQFSARRSRLSGQALARLSNYRLKTRRSPSSTLFSSCPRNLPAGSVRNPQSIVMT
jgi:hypothetical protein